MYDPIEVKNKESIISPQLSNNSITVDKKNDLTESIFKGLEEYIKNNNINVEFYESLKTAYDNDPVAVYNAINQTIKVNTNKADITTLPEELGHHLTLALGDKNILVKRALNLIKRTNYKEELGPEYVEIYKDNDELLRKEQLGKLISKTIANKLQNKIVTDENSAKLWDTIKRLIDAFVKLFKPDSNIFNDLQQDIDKLSDIIITGQKVKQTSEKMPNLDFFSLSNSSKKEIPKEYQIQYTYFKKRIIKHKNDISKYKKQIEEKGPSKELLDNIKYSELEIKKIQATLDALVQSNDKQFLINLSKDTLDTIEEYVKKLETEELTEISLKNLEHIMESIDIFVNFKGTREQANDLRERIQPFIKKYSLQLVNNFKTNKITIEDIEQDKEDITTGIKNFGTLVDIKNYLGKTIGALIKNAQSNIERANKKSYESLKKEVKALEEYQNIN